MDGPNRTTTKANGPVPPHRPARSVAWIIAASSFAFAVIQLDVTIVNVALSKISADFGATVADLQWVVSMHIRLVLRHCFFQLESQLIDWGRNVSSLLD
jgi:DHA2 family methylenomycin A resistance protein-like MFS transporter